MTDEANRALPFETGGVLLGYWSEDRSEVAITDVTGPGPRASHSKTEFIPDDEYQDRLIDEIYARSGRRHRYLGDWHTHPFGEESLSYKDRRTLQRIAGSEGKGVLDPLMAVLASNHEAWRLCVWRYQRPVSTFDRIVLRCARECVLVEYSGDGCDPNKIGVHTAAPQ